MAQNTNSIKIVTPVGRLLQGDVFTGRDTDMNGQPYTYKRGAKAGQPYSKYIAVIGIEKTNPEWAEFWAKIAQCAQTGMPNMFGADGNPLREFHWKYVDGDSDVPDQGGRAPRDKQGFAGCHILRFTANGYAPKACDENAELLTDPNSINRGDYIRIVGTVTPNGDMTKPGIYVEQQLIQRIGYGPRIQTGIDPAKELAANAVGYVPQGVSAAPLAPAAVPAAPAHVAPAAVPAAQPVAPAFAPPGMAPAAPPQMAPVAPGVPAVQPAAPAPNPAAGFLKPPQ